jgi:hypothetical protein
MLEVTFRDTTTGVQQTASIPSAHAPALRSAINERRNEVGERASGAHKFLKEAALTRGISALGILAAALNSVVPEEDPCYEGISASCR